MNDEQYRTAYVAALREGDERKARAVVERFYRTPQSLGDGIKGSGLGLYFCRRIVEEHEGRIWIGDPAHGDSGTSVHVVLPKQIDCEALNARR